jgi:uncharacterized protein YpmB
MDFRTHSFMFDVFPIIFSVMFLLIATVIVIAIIKAVTQWNKNNHSPRLTVQATIVAKRYNTSHHHHGTQVHMHHSSTTYYATFQVESGDRMELLIPSTQFGYLVEGDTGKLSFQGTRFISFDRT